MVSTYSAAEEQGSSSETLFLSGELAVELVPQGTFAERIPAQGGAGYGRRILSPPTGFGNRRTRRRGRETRVDRRSVD
jgi:acyl CoA:acetate/3-ketoacid CoA transferase alpha subunit